MNLRPASALVAMPLLLAGMPAHAGDFDYDGSWKGTIAFDTSASAAPPPYTVDRAVYALVIHGSDVEVTVTEPKDGKDYPFCNGNCFFTQTASNAIIVGINRNDPGKDGIYWVESWTLSATLKDPDHMLVEFTRVVRNVGIEKLKPDKDYPPEFAERGEGVFERTEAPPPPAPQPSKPGDT